MKRSQRVSLILLAFAVVTGVLVWPREREPVYQGKTLSEWLKAYSQPIGAMRPVISPEAADAVRHIGTNGLPFLVRWIQDVPKTPQRRERLFILAYRWNMRSSARSDVLEALAGRELRAGRAFWGFKILGQDARPAIPDLVHVAKNGNESSAPSAIAALAYLGKDAFPPLLEFAADPEFKFRDQAMAAIGEMHYLGTNAHAAVPFLIGLLEDREWDYKAADVLGRLSLESSISVPALVTCLRSTNSTLRLCAVISLGKFGEQARAAMPDLLKILDDPELDVRTRATNALRQIAPEPLTNAGQ